MGGLNFLGLGGGTPKPIGGSGSKPSMSNYKFGQAGKTIIKVGETKFGEHVSNEKWKTMVRSGGKKEFKLLRGENKGQVLKDVDLKKEVGKILKQRGGRGITGKDLKMKLVRKVGMSFKDAETIARAATYHYYESPAEGRSKKQVLATIKGSEATGRMADEIQNSSMGAQLKDKKKRGGATQAEDVAYAKERLGVEGEEYSEYAGGKKGKVELSERETKSGEKKSFGQSGEETVGIGGRHGKQTKVAKETAVPEKKESSQQSVLIAPRGGGTPGISSDEKTPSDTDGNKAIDNVIAGGVVNRSGEVLNFHKEKLDNYEKEPGNKKIDFEAEIQRIKDADVALAATESGEE